MYFMCNNLKYLLLTKLINKIIKYFFSFYPSLKASVLENSKRRREVNPEEEEEWRVQSPFRGCCATRGEGQRSEGEIREEQGSGWGLV